MSGKVGRPPRWAGALLAHLQAAYIYDARKLDAVAYDFGTTASKICQVAKAHAWPRRSAA